MKQNIWWQCRRGMLELDIKFNHFMQVHYDKLPKSEQEQFAKLLDFPDENLFSWIFKANQTYPKTFSLLIKLLKSH